MRSSYLDIPDKYLCKEKNTKDVEARILHSPEVILILTDRIIYLIKNISMNILQKWPIIPEEELSVKEMYGQSSHKVVLKKSTNN